MEITFKTASAEETQALGERIGSCLRGGEVIAYKGGLGAGKTAMTGGIARGMGITCPVTSPTFTIVNEYPGAIPLYHFDMYRICSYEGLESAGFFDYPDGNSVIVIEWWENVEDFLPEISPITITIKPLGESREITLAAPGELLRALGDFEC